MREIHPRHGNLSILAHSYYCGATTNATFCPRALSVNYNSMEIVLTITTTGNGKEESLVSLLAGRAPRPYCKHGATQAKMKSPQDQDYSPLCRYDL